MAGAALRRPAAGWGRGGAGGGLGGVRVVQVLHQHLGGVHLRRQLLGRGQRAQRLGLARGELQGHAFAGHAQSKVEGAGHVDSRRVGRVPPRRATRAGSRRVTSTMSECKAARATQRPKRPAAAHSGPGGDTLCAYELQEAGQDAVGHPPDHLSARVVGGEGEGVPVRQVVQVLGGGVGVQQLVHPHPERRLHLVVGQRAPRRRRGGRRRATPRCRGRGRSGAPARRARPAAARGAPRRSPPLRASPARPWRPGRRRPAASARRGAPCAPTRGRPRARRGGSAAAPRALVHRAAGAPRRPARAAARRRAERRARGQRGFERGDAGVGHGRGAARAYGAAATCPPRAERLSRRVRSGNVPLPPPTPAADGATGRRQGRPRAHPRPGGAHPLHPVGGLRRDVRGEGVVQVREPAAHRLVQGARAR